MKMNRRLLFTFAVLLPLILGFAAWRVAERRPTIIGRDVVGRDAWNDTLLLSDDGSLLLHQNAVDGVLSYTAWDVRQKKRLWQQEIYGQIALSPDGRWLAAAGEGHENTSCQVRLFDARTGRPHVWLRLNEASNDGTIYDVQWSIDGNELHVLSSRAVLHFDADKARLQSRVAVRLPQGATWGQFSDDSQTVVSGATQSVWFLDANTGQPKKQITLPTRTKSSQPVFVVDVSPQVNLLMVLIAAPRPTELPTWSIVRVSDERLLWNFAGDSEHFPHFSSDGQFVVVNNGQQIIARHATTGQEAWRLEAPDTRAAIFSPNGHFIYDLDKTGTIRRWKVPAS